jgi:hypothetical protein
MRIYREPLDEPGDPLFWAPLLALFAGLRMEEALQLRADDFYTELGVPYLRVRITDENQRLKSVAAQRRVPVHRSLLDLGLLDLVELRRATGQGRIFTHLDAVRTRASSGKSSRSASRTTASATTSTRRPRTSTGYARSSRRA